MQKIMLFYRIHPTLCIIWIILLILLVICIMRVLFSKYKFITCTEATLLINKQDAKIIDIRPKDEYYYAHIPNSLNILGTDIKNGLYGELDQYKNCPLIIVGSGINPMDETEIASKLSNSGFQKIYILESGIISWNNDYLPLVNGS
ncbi:MAG: rhodanese-like domain-containing protein [Candidatus Dasytiphilus stammeri]